MASRTHYQVLGVDRDASSVDIASAFREKLDDAKSKPAAPEQLEALREAYQTLANPVTRAEYDATLPQRAAPRRAKPVPVAVEGASSDRRRKQAMYAIPVVIFVLAIWGWKTRKPPEVPVVVQPMIIPEAARPAPAPAQAAANPAFPATSGAPLPPPARNAEQVFADVSGSVVRVMGADAKGRLTQQGSGVVIDTGRVITNCHVAKGVAQLAVKWQTVTRPARIWVADEELDLCSLDVANLDASAVTIGTVNTLRTGQRVYAIGAPHGLELTISEGIVSSLREVAGGKVIQTTAPVSPGSSGGGLFAADGQLVGIVTYQHRFGQNLNFALPADWIAEMRTRSGAPEGAAASTAELSVAEMVVGTWFCFGSLSGRNGEYTYTAKGEVRIVSNDGRNFGGPYKVSGRRIVYLGSDGGFAFDIETLTRDRMVQIVGDGQRLACERR